ncbi:GNAT family N-acetyltransferase [Nocardia halotolerans]|uniref:GNAT family N-acetyltransferase n=1 Tax=Nocardia halotolerans TaxID=1755878 RepID=A0ABV8VIU0_9NOCA
MHIEVTGDAARFLADAEPWLRRDPLRHTVITTSLANQVRGRFSGTKFLSVRADGGRVLGVAQCTADGRAYLDDLPETGISSVTEALMAHCGPLRSVEGAAAEVDAFVAHWAQAHGTHRKDYSARLFRLGRLSIPAAPGAARPAEERDTDLCLDWVHAFDAEIGAARRLARAAAQRLIEAGLWWVWEADGTPTAFAARQAAVFGWARIGPVYTPPPLRGQGYASALTAAVAGRIRAEGADVCLFTDLANPTSNKIYQAIGFEPVRDFVNHELIAG